MEQGFDHVGVTNFMAYPGPQIYQTFGFWNFERIRNDELKFIQEKITTKINKHKKIGEQLILFSCWNLS